MQIGSLFLVLSTDLLLKLNTLTILIYCSDVVNFKLDCCEHLLCIDCVKRVNFICPQCRRDFTDYYT